MKALNLPKWQPSIQTPLYLGASATGIIALASNSEALLNGLKLVWNSSGYASLALAPLSLLLATTVFRDITEDNCDQAVLNRHYRIVAAIAPMAGFLGTVLGIMGATQSLGTTSDVETLISMVDQIFGRMGVAFTTSAWGLILAMIAVLMMRLKKEDAEDNTKQLERIASLLEVIEADLNDVRPVARRTILETQKNGGNRYESINV